MDDMTAATDDVLVLKYFCHHCKRVIEVLNHNKCSLCDSAFVELSTESQIANTDETDHQSDAYLKSPDNNEQSRPEKTITCAICLNPLNETKRAEDVSFSLKCRHKYHKLCLEKWFEEHNTCPLCRIRVDVSSVNSRLRGRPRHTCEETILEIYQLLDLIRAETRDSANTTELVVNIGRSRANAMLSSPSTARIRGRGVRRYRLRQRFNR